MIINDYKVEDVEVGCIVEERGVYRGSPMVGIITDISDICEGYVSFFGFDGTSAYSPYMEFCMYKLRDDDRHSQGYQTLYKPKRLLSILYGIN